MHRALLLALALTACSSDGSDELGRSCAGLPTATTVTLPTGIPVGVEDATLYRSQTAGATTFYYGWVRGTDVVAVRDTVATAFERAGLAIESRDEEPPAEAEFQFSGEKDEGSVQVTPLCDGHLTLRWRVGPR